MDEAVRSVFEWVIENVSWELILVLCHSLMRRFPNAGSNLSRWPKGPDSWAPTAILPAFIVAMAYVILYDFFWGMAGAVVLLAVYAHYSLPGVVNIQLRPHICGNVTATARVEVVSPPLMEISGRRIPNPVYSVRRYLKRLNRA